MVATELGEAARVDHCGDVAASYAKLVFAVRSAHFFARGITVAMHGKAAQKNRR
ncbi:MAG: hypothetical protein H6972_15460 [Gammaproteobacteria bacterium]|nr:hypothetical protein [Gammaproteobacteria bacterium]